MLQRKKLRDSIVFGMRSFIFPTGEYVNNILCKNVEKETKHRWRHWWWSCAIKYIYSGCGIDLQKTKSIRILRCRRQGCRQTFQDFGE